ncbi:hypothetical protein ZWY2020_050493 [Hordeum vulgare]|nr:hypothetical protein ZWY2020_050493 [Hordeum vulgare]
MAPPALNLAGSDSVHAKSTENGSTPARSDRIRPGLDQNLHQISPNCNFQSNAQCRRRRKIIRRAVHPRGGYTKDSYFPLSSMYVLVLPIESSVLKFAATCNQP